MAIKPEAEKPWLPLLHQARAGDRQAFAGLVAEFSPLVFHIAYSVVWQVQDAEDVVQETFLKAYLNLRGLREVRAFPAWIGRIARNLAQNRQRYRRARPVVALDDYDPGGLLAGTGGPQEALEATETRAALEAAIRALPEHYRTPLLLRLKAGTSYEEIAAILEIPVGTVRSRIHAARERVAAALAAGQGAGRPG
jgi:RNA polymerase sigma-70 factor (ECF subfamily)